MNKKDNEDEQQQPTAQHRPQPSLPAKTSVPVAQLRMLQRQQQQRHLEKQQREQREQQPTRRLHIPFDDGSNSAGNNCNGEKDKASTTQVPRIVVSDANGRRVSTTPASTTTALPTRTTTNKLMAPAATTTMRSSSPPSTTSASIVSSLAPTAADSASSSALSSSSSSALRRHQSTSNNLRRMSRVPVRERMANVEVSPLCDVAIDFKTFSVC